MTKAQVAAMTAHARAEAPNEACGLLAGSGGEVAAVHCLQNARHSPFAYELDAEGYRLLIELDEAGQLLAAFHSHTQSEAYPSATDRRQAYWPIRYVLVSLKRRNPEVRVFTIAKKEGGSGEVLGEVQEERLEIV